MMVREHKVSHRNGPQIMVAGLKLRDMGYCRGAEVSITDLTEHSANVPWRFVVSNDEYATLVSRNPEPPSWIQPGVRIRIEVLSGEPVESAPTRLEPTPPRTLSATDLAEWRRSLIRILNTIEGAKTAPANEGLAARIGRLGRAGRIPREIVAFMRTVTEMRNQTEYEDKVPTSTESEAVSAAWRAVGEWARRQA